MTQHTTTSSTSITISRLTNGIQYSFQVKATNSVGDSGPATASATPRNQTRQTHQPHPQRRP